MWVLTLVSWVIWIALTQRVVELVVGHGVLSCWCMLSITDSCPGPAKLVVAKVLAGDLGDQEVMKFDSLHEAISISRDPRKERGDGGS